MGNWGVLTYSRSRYITALAKTKGDGVHSYQGVLYLIKNKTPTHYAMQGFILEMYKGFLVILDVYDPFSPAHRLVERKKMNALKKKLTGHRRDSKLTRHCNINIGNVNEQ